MLVTLHVLSLIKEFKNTDTLGLTKFVDQTAYFICAVLIHPSQSVTELTVRTCTYKQLLVSYLLSMRYFDSNVSIIALLFISSAA